MKQVAAEDSRLIKSVAVIGDFIILNLVFILVYLSFNGFEYNHNIAISLQKYLTILNLCYIPAISTFKVIFHYRIVSPEKIIRGVILTVSMLIVLFVTVLALMQTNNMPRLLFFIFYIVFLICVCIWRLSMRKMIKTYRRKGKNSRTAAIVGSGSNVVELYHEITDDSTFGYKVAGVFNDSPIEDFPENTNYLGTVSDVIPYLQANQVNEIFCSLPSIRQADILPIINYCENNLIRFYGVPNVRNYVKRKMKLELFGDIPVLYIRDEPLLKPENRLLKRAFDIFCSGLFLCTLYPILYIIVGSIIKITSPGPIYFRQERSGENGNAFYCLKFRSMKINEDCDTLQATENDPRKTKFGNFIRKTNIDEFPQFINVFKGEMSLVGPRPHMLKHTDEYSRLINKYMVRHLVKPGITGWAQVTGFRGETKELYQMEGRVRKDIWYIENWSFLLDLRIMYKTVINVILGDKNAY